MESRRPRRAVVALVVALLLLVGILFLDENRGAQDSGVVQAAGSASVAVTGSDSYSFTPSGFNDVATNTLISVAFTDAGTDAHTFSILNRQGVVIPTSTTSDQLTALFAMYGYLGSVNASGTGTVDGTFTSPGPGWYEFVCLEPGHFELGMYGFIAFGEALPANLTVSSPNEGPGTAVFIIIGTIVSLTVIAIVLGFVVGRRRGSSDEMPPERLGYPEPQPPPGPSAPLPPEQPPKF